MNDKLTIWFLVILAIFLVNISYAQAVTDEDTYIFEKDKQADLRISCFDAANKPCDIATYCHISVFEPDSDVLVHNGTMTRNETYYNYSLSPEQTDDTGIYSSVVYCDGSVDTYTSFTFEITPNGEKPTTAQGILYIGLFTILSILFILSLVGVFKQDNVYVKFTLAHLSYIMYVAWLFIVWEISSNFLTSITFLTGFTFALFRTFIYTYFVFVIATVIWLITELRNIQLIKNMLEKGMPEDEAIKRSKKKGKDKW